LTYKTLGFKNIHEIKLKRPDIPTASKILTPHTQEWHTNLTETSFTFFRKDTGDWPCFVSVS